MAAPPHTIARRAALAIVLAGALLCESSPARSAEIIGTPKNSASAAVQITSCSVTIDPENANAYPAVDLTPVPNSPIVPVSTQVELDLHDALGGSDATRVLTVPVAPSKIPLASYPVDGNFVGLACHLRSVTFADGSVVGIGYQGGSGGGGPSGATLGILGGLALIGGIAAVAGHGSGGSAATAPTPTPTPFPITHSATPSPSPSPPPSPPPSASPTPSPTPSPVPTPSPTPTAGALVVTPQTLTFLATGSAYAKTAQASEANYTGRFTASPASCVDSNGIGSGGTASTVASISPASSTSGLFTVTPIGPGTCTFQIMDSLGDQQILSIGVTTTTGIVQSRPAPHPQLPAQPGPAPKH